MQPTDAAIMGNLPLSQGIETVREIEQALSESNAMKVILAQKVLSLTNRIEKYPLDVDSNLEKSEQALLAALIQKEKDTLAIRNLAETTVLAAKAEKARVEPLLAEAKFRVNNALSSSRQYASLAEQREVALAAYQEGIHDYETITVMSEKKLEGYKNPAYQHLLKVGYHTAGYQPIGLVEIAEGFLAAQCDFHANFERELALLALHDNGAKEVSKLRLKVEEAEASLARYISEEEKVQDVSVLALLHTQLVETLASGIPRVTAAGEELLSIRNKLESMYDRVTKAIAYMLSQPAIQNFLEEAKYGTAETLAQKLVTAKQELSAQHEISARLAQDELTARQASEAARRFCATSKDELAVSK